MENGDQYLTPQKLFKSSPSLKFFSSGKSKLGVTPKGKFMKSFNLFPKTKITPCRFSKVINPFEAALTEKLHLPLIGSPSLFQRPSTPQHSSTQFEWTIDELSSLGPANVEAHETQFHTTPDPALEAKAQAAISSYFKEQLKVLSPIDCQLRNQKITLASKVYANSSSGSDEQQPKAVKRIRDGICQTVLTFPPKLPAHVQDILKQYLIYNVDQQQSPTVTDCDKSVDYEARDASLRRKLFETSLNTTNDDCDVDINELANGDEKLSTPPRTPEMNLRPLDARAFLDNSCHHIDSHISLSITLSPVLKNSFGSLSPILKLEATSDVINQPIQCAILETTDSKLCAAEMEADQSFYRSTPEKNNLGNLEITEEYIKSEVSATELDILMESSFNDEDDDNVMQISQLSEKSNSSSGSSHIDTPVRKGRGATRKNLSRSFSCNMPEVDSQYLICEDFMEFSKGGEDNFRTGSAKSYVSNSNSQRKPSTALFERTDSGFNEMTTISSITQEAENF